MAHVISAVWILLSFSAVSAQTHRVDFSELLDRPWAGPEFWGNRTQDWVVRDGRLQCVAGDALTHRTAHWLVVSTDGTGALSLEVTLGTLTSDPLPSALGGVLLGVGGDGIDPRAAALVHQWPGEGAGWFLGTDPTGRVWMEDRTRPAARVQRGNPTRRSTPPGLRLRVEVTPAGGSMMRVRVTTRALDGGAVVDDLAMEIPAGRMRGGVALVSHPGDRAVTPAGRGTGWWFGSVVAEGPGIQVDASRRFGPIATTLYTLHRGCLKMTAQFLPLGALDDPQARLEAVGGDGIFREIARAHIDRRSYTAAFRVGDWDDTRDVPYRVVFSLRQRSGPAEECALEGVVRKDPKDAEEIVLAALACQHQNSHRLGQGDRTDWSEVMWFPHQDVVDAVQARDPDLLFFAGDQVYEGKSPTFADRSQIERDYLYKWYLFCWTWKDALKDRPAVVLPDDHDVYQGNLWGEGGGPTRRDVDGGYVHPASFVQLVHRTQTGHLPDSPDPNPVDQGIPVAFSALQVGPVSFAILEDRKFKSGCGRDRLPASGSLRRDHVMDPAVPAESLNPAGLELLGARQHGFLDDWVRDWRGHFIKAALSQTVFAGMATHHGPALQRIRADLDSNGWPASGRDAAVRALRRGFATHIAGDQHLATLIQHGVDAHRDGIWSFAVPSVANFYPRQWLPEEAGVDPLVDGVGWMGDHRDGLGNRVTVYAVTNPRNSGREPRDLHDANPGFGVVRFRVPDQLVTFECWQRGLDQQYPGWPRTIRTADNFVPPEVHWLPRIEVKGVSCPLFEVMAESTGEWLYGFRARTGRYRPFTPMNGGTFSVRVSDPETGRQQTLTGLTIVPEDSDAVREVVLP